MTQLVRLEMLRQVCDRLLDRLESEYGQELDLTQTPIAEYWEFDLETAFKCEESPGKQAGDFRSDLEEVREVLGRSDDEIVLWHDLDHLASVLRGIAYLDLGSHTSSPDRAEGS